MKVCGYPLFDFFLIPAHIIIISIVVTFLQMQPVKESEPFRYEMYLRYRIPQTDSLMYVLYCYGPYLLRSTAHFLRDLLMTVVCVMSAMTSLTVSL